MVPMIPRASIVMTGARIHNEARTAALDTGGAEKAPGSRYLRQNAGVTMTRTVSSSSLPSSIVTLHTQVWKSVSTEKLVAGPTWCRPGPMLLRDATTAENAV